jgi:hypothetical protein
MSSVCKSCSYDNPYVDIANYVCYQCNLRAKAWGGGYSPQAGPAKLATPQAGVIKRRVKRGDYLYRIDNLGNVTSGFALEPIVSETRYIIPIDGDLTLRPQISRDNAANGGVFMKGNRDFYWCHADGTLIDFYFR